MSQSWTPAQDQALLFYWNKGVPTKEIMRKLERSRGSVLGRVHRLKGNPRPNPIQGRVYAKKPAKICGNPDCLKEVDISHGHKDRGYCDSTCASRAWAIKEKLRRDIIVKERVGEERCDRAGCMSFAVPRYHLCYSHA